MKRVERQQPAERKSRSVDSSRSGTRVAVPARVAAKLALYDEVRAAGLTKTDLARRLAVPDTEARRRLDLDHPTKMDRLERGLASFGVGPMVTTREPTG